MICMQKRANMKLSPSRQLFLIFLLTLISLANSQNEESRHEPCRSGKIPFGRLCNVTEDCPTDLNLRCLEGKCGCSSQHLWSLGSCYCTFRAGDFGCLKSRHCTDGAKCYHQCPRRVRCEGTCDCCEGNNRGNAEGICPPSDCGGSKYGASTLAIGVVIVNILQNLIS